MNNKLLSAITCSITLLILAFHAGTGLGATLYDRSLVQLKARAEHASPHDYSFVVLGDSRGNDEVFKKALKLARSYKPLFILHGGDYSDSGGAEETRQFLAIVNQALQQIPLFVVMGNHENREVFASNIGPFDFTLESRRLGLTLVALDNSDEVLKSEQLEYLRSRLASSAGASFVAMHVPPKTERWSWHSFSDGADQLEWILRKGHVQGAIFSHVHLYDRAEFGGVPAIITGGAGAPLVRLGFPGEAVHHIVVVRVRDGKASFLKVPIPK
jgi:3',5'-cyclic-AMP phosphodiesterase